MKKIGPVIAILIGMFAATYGRDMMRDWLGGGDLTSAEALSEVAEELTKKCPMKVDEETELIKVEGREATIIYTYRLINMAMPDFQPMDVVALRPQIRDSMCQNSDSRKILKAGTSIHCVYYDRNDKHITTMEFAPADCGL